MILRSLVEGDELHLVEVNPHFCRHLETRLLRRHRRENPGARVDLRCESITSAVFADPFDIVICTLPFFAFSPPVVRVILDRLTGLLAEGGELTYMHFAGVRLLKAPFVTPSRRRELDRIHAVSRSLRRRYGATRDFVLFNVLPSFVVRLRRNGVAARHRPGPWMRRMALAAEAYSAQGAEVG
jgi:phospholipid N-methyltransferase